VQRLPGGENCPGSPLKMVLFLDGICEDCYLLYRDIGIYQLCRYHTSHAILKEK